MTSLPDLLARATSLVRPGRRALLGVAGAPGSGKSTLAAELGKALASPVVPMDGFHLSNEVLAELGLSHRKGSPDSFDAPGFKSLLTRLREPSETVYAPEFRREIEQAIAGALPIPSGTPLVIVEGNYLLLDEGQWQGTAQLLDEVWFLDPADDVRIERLVLRHVRHGRSRADAEHWVESNDQPNARLVAASAHRADLVIRL